MSGKYILVGWMEGLQAVQPRGGASASETNMAVTPQQWAQCVVWCTKFSSVARTQRAFRNQYNCHHVPYTSGHSEMAEHVPGKWPDYASHRRKCAWQEQAWRHLANHDSESSEVTAPFVNWEKPSIHYKSDDCPAVPQHVSIPHICDISNGSLCILYRMYQEERSKFWGS
jgi:hypothetical protein